MCDPLFEYCEEDENPQDTAPDTSAVTPSSVPLVVVPQLTVLGMT